MHGGELRVEGQLRRPSAGGDDLRRRVRRFVDVRTREVELDRLDAVEPTARLSVVAGAEASDADPEWSSELAQLRQVVLEKALAPRIGEADRVQHPVRGLGDPRRRTPL